MPGQAVDIAGFVDILGPAHVLAEPGLMHGYLVDWSGDWIGSTTAILRPGSVAEVQACVRLCADLGVAIVPQGGNTGLVVGGFAGDLPRNVVVSLSRLNAIRSVDAVNFSLDVDAGCTLQQVKDAAEAEDCFFPLALGAQGSCQIGGNVATNAGGINVLRYGMARDLVLGLETVLPDGSLWSANANLRKDNRGYDLKQLLLGSEGTLGIVTGVGLKLFPRPATVATAYVGLKSFADAMTLLGRARRTASDLVTAFEVIGTECLPLAREIDPAIRAPVSETLPVHALIELSCSSAIDGRGVLEAVLAEGLENGLVADAVIAQSGAQARTFWSIREGLVEGQGRRGFHIRTDVSVRLGRVPDFIDAARAAIADGWPGWAPLAYGHAGDGNIHLNVLPPDGLPRDDAREIAHAIVKRLYDTVADFNGSISAEHGIGRSRRDTFWSALPAIDRRLFRSVKAAFDPAGLMNPGCLIPHSEDA